MNFITKFQEIVKKYPKNIAILTNGHDKLSYLELHNQSVRLAQALKLNGVKKNDIVALALPKSSKYIIAILAAWMRRAVFLPLSPDLPKERRMLILKQARPRIIIGDHEALHDFHEESDKIINIYDILSKKSAIYLRIDTDIKQNDSAYIIYTSGSTGFPKGVVITHRGIVNFLNAQIKLFKITAKSRFLFFVSTNFDASISDIGVTLLSGATLCIEEAAKGIELAAKLPKILKDRKISHIDIPPSLLEILSIDKTPPTLKTIIIGGETLPIKIIKKWASKFRLINIYGPTEATVCTSMVLCNPVAWDGPNIGQPIPQTEYKILNSNKKEVNDGQIGELYIAGIGLAKGYLKNKKLTREKFVYINKKRYYRTGDLVKRVDKKIYFLSRVDRQIKIHGQLVAPEEIELQLQAHREITRAAVLLPQQKNKKRLTAFIETRDGKEIDIGKIKQSLGRKLPNWMWPNEIIKLSHLPTNTSGKIDYERLKFLYRGDAKDKKIMTKDILANKIIKAWQKVLGKIQIGLDDDFFALGGDSLAVLQVVVELEKYGIKIPIGLLAKTPTIRQIISWHKNNKKMLSDGILVERFKNDIAITKEWRALFKKTKFLSRSNEAPRRKLRAISQQAARYLAKENKNNILLTGANGFLGIYVLREILKQTTAGRIFVLIRAQDKKDALSRLKTTAQKFNLIFNRREVARIYPLCGDISKSNFDLDKKIYEQVSNEVNTIYHCAGIVNAVLPYEKLKATNVLGTKNIVKFALHNTKKKLNYASTLSVFVGTDKNKNTVFEKDDLSKTKIIYGGYAASKWVAEKFLQQIPENVLPKNIFRFGLLTGDSQTGNYSSHDYLEMFIRGIISLGEIPKGKHESLFLDATPVDYAGQVMVYIGQKSSCGTYHIANTRGFSLKMILDSLREKGIKIKHSLPKNWMDRLQKRNLTIEESAAVSALARLVPDEGAFERLRSMDLFQATDIKFDMTNTRRFTKNTKIKIPKADKNLLNKYLNYSLKK